MLDKNNMLLSQNDNVKVLLFFNGFVESFGHDNAGRDYAIITWEMKSGFKVGQFYSEEISLQ